MAESVLLSPVLYPVYQKAGLRPEKVARDRLVALPKRPEILQVADKLRAKPARDRS